MNWIIYSWGWVFGYFIILRYFMLPTGLEPYEELTKERAARVLGVNILLTAILWTPIWIWLCVKFISKL